MVACLGEFKVFDLSAECIGVFPGSELASLVGHAAN